MKKIEISFIIFMVQLLWPVELYDVKLQTNSVYIIKNEEYPNSYKSKADIEWSISSPVNTSLYIACQLTLPPSIACSGDYIAVHLGTGPQTKFCDKVKINADAETNNIKIIFHAEDATSGGSFRCRLKAIEANLPETPNCECGWKLMEQARILGGNYTIVNEYPSMAYLVNTRTGYWPGAANIISEKYALTASHVIYNLPLLTLVVGDYNLTSGSETQYFAKYDIKRYIMHPKYNHKNFKNDIAIVETKDPITFNLYVGPICLPFRFKSKTFAGEKVTALGWGQIKANGSDSDALRKVDLTVVRHRDCTGFYEPSVRRTELCTLGQGGKDACAGDSGGPILWENPANRRLFLVGIIESGDSCGTGIPSLNTRVTSYLAWILSVVDDAKFCLK